MENESKRKKSFNWLGWVIFLLLFVGPNLARPLSHMLSQITGGNVSVNFSGNIIPFIIVGIVLLTILSTIVRSIGKAFKPNDTLPTSLPTNTSSMSSYQGQSYSFPSTMSTNAQAKYDTFPDDDDDDDMDWDELFERPSSSQPSRYSSSQPSRYSSYASTKSIPFSSSPFSSSTMMKSTKLPSAPKYEPIVTPKAILFGILGVIVAGGGLAVATLINAVFP